MIRKCLNCGEPAPLHYCPLCGQSVTARRGPLLGLLGDFFTEFFSLDGRHLRTAVGLLVPGKLTELFLAGRRASHVPPVRVYFVASLFFFLLVGFPVPDADDFNVYVDEQLVGRTAPDPGAGNMHLLRIDESGWLGRKVAQSFEPKVAKLQAMSAQELLDRFFAGLERTFPTALICFVPVLALALRLLYLRSPFFYVDHLIFALHFQSFLFALLVLARFANLAGLGRLLPGLVTYLAAFLLFSPLYLLLGLRRVFGQSWGRTTLKTLTLLLLYSILIQPLVLATMFLVIRAM